MDIAVEAPSPADRPSPQAPPLGSPSWAGFYLLAPLLSALPLGWYGAGIAAQFPFAASMLLWISIGTMSWWLSDLASRGIAKLTSGQTLPVLCLTMGYIVNLLLSSVYNPALLWWMVEAGIVGRTTAIDAYFAVNRNLLDLDYLRLLTAAGVPGLFVWLAGNYIFELITGVPRFRVRSALDAEQALPVSPSPVAEPSFVPPALPRFFQRLSRFPGIDLSELLAVEAEDHYIQVHTTRGTELVYYRFGDALEELAALDGLRIHRSAWVSRKAVARVESEGRNMHVVVSSGARFKVSLSNRGAVLSALPTGQ